MSRQRGDEVDELPPSFPFVFMSKIWHMEKFAFPLLIELVIIIFNPSQLKLIPINQTNTKIFCGPMTIVGQKYNRISSETL